LGHSGIGVFSSGSYLPSSGGISPYAHEYATTTRAVFTRMYGT
jgi:hypothetical protein